MSNINDLETLFRKLNISEEKIAEFKAKQAEQAERAEKAKAEPKITTPRTFQTLRELIQKANKGN